MEAKRKRDYFTGLYTAGPYHESTIRQNSRRISETRRQFDRIHNLVETSLKSSRKKEAALSFSRRVSDYRGRRSEASKVSAYQATAIESARRMNDSMRGLKEQLDKKRQIIAEGDLRLRERLNKTAKHVLQRMSAVHKRH